MCVNIGHGDERVIKAIQEQADDARLRQSVHGHRAARAARREAGRDHARRHRRLLLHQRRRRGQRERDQDRAAGSPGATRSWRATARTTAAPAGAITLTGDPRRWATEPGMPGVVHVLDPYHGIQRGWDDRAPRRWRTLEEIDPARGAADDRRVHPRDGDRHQRHPGPARRLPARACASSATSTAS